MIAKTKRIVPVLLLTFAACAMHSPASAQQRQLVLNPYEGVNWQETGRYRANFHTHTTVSDGLMNPHEVVDLYHAHGYTILALTDHDTHNNFSTYPWTDFVSLSPSQRSINLLAEGRLQTDHLNFQNRDPQQLGMLPVAASELSRGHHIISLFSTATHPQEGGVAERMATVNQHNGVAFMAHPAMHWPTSRGVTAGPELGLRAPFWPELRRVTQSDFTVETWFKTTAAGRGILVGNYSGSYRGALNLELHTGNRVRVYLQGPSHVVDLNVTPSGVNTRDGQWHHLAGVRRGNRVELFLNGTMVGDAADRGESFDLSGEHYFLGRDTRTDVALDGSIDEPRVWSRALSPAEIAQIAQQGQMPADNGLVVRYPIEGASLIERLRGRRAGNRAAPGLDEATAQSLRFEPSVATPLQNAETSSLSVSFLMPTGQTMPYAVPDWAIDYYAELYRRHPELIGQEVLNGTRSHIREYPMDRELWDGVLTQLMPDRPVWGFSVDDLHNTGHLARDWVMVYSTDLQIGPVRQAVEGGAFTASTIRLHGGSDLHAAYAATPVIDSITHDLQAGTITIAASVEGRPLRDDECVWIANGEAVHTGLTINYTTTEGVKGYVRAELTGPQGKTYTNPFGFRTND
ncbi:MAG: hypothetical protein EA423_12490 [Phycisphaerales bacterium]|nr:MAG: hypothetical protein EA423_12490 [Phycisphaerales bacterium]